MTEFANFIGFFLSHAIWSVSDGEMLVPFIAAEGHHGRTLARYPGDNQTMVEKLEHQLAGPPNGDLFRIICYDGYFTNQGKRKDAVYGNARSLSHDSNAEINLVVPYAPSTDPAGFKVFRPKYIDLPDSNIETFTEALWAGIFSHEQGSAVWNEHIDQTE